MEGLIKAYVATRYLEGETADRIARLYMLYSRAFPGPHRPQGDDVLQVQVVIMQWLLKGWRDDDIVEYVRCLEESCTGMEESAAITRMRELAAKYEEKDA